MSNCPLLIAAQGCRGSFIKWLESLGLKQFLNQYPLPTLAAWGWIEPAYRLLTPIEMVNFSIPTEIHFPPLPKTNPYERLWNPEWRFAPDEDPEWFLHPIFRSEDPAAILLSQQPQPANRIAVPSPTQEPSGIDFWPYDDYYYHWQAYALLDIIQWADCIQPILNTPNVVQKSEGISRIAARLKQDKNDPTWVLHSPQRWQRWRTLLTMLSHYRALMEQVTWQEMARQKRDHAFKIYCSASLAKHFALDAAGLERMIREELLVLAQEFSTRQRMQRSPFDIDWRACCWHEIQRDVYLAVQWLCHLTGNELDHYMALWSDPPHQQREAAAELADVLPFAFYSQRKQFLRSAPHYLKDFNKLARDDEKLEGDRLAARVDALRLGYATFESAVYAFSEMHDAMTWDTQHRGLHFGDRRPLVHYAHFALRAEAALREYLKKHLAADDESTLPSFLPALIRACAAQQGIPQNIIAEFDRVTHLRKKLNPTMLFDQPPNPVAVIQSLPTSLSGLDQHLFHAFLYTCVARNYFSHHHYLDDKLMYTKESALMIGGILITMLILIAPLDYGATQHK
jgi:hypothetical protein